MKSPVARAGPPTKVYIGKNHLTLELIPPFTIRGVTGMSAETVFIVTIQLYLVSSNWGTDRSREMIANLSHDKRLHPFAAGETKPHRSAFALNLNPEAKEWTA